MEEPKVGADTRLDPLSRLPQSVLTSIKTARLCYLERPTPVKSEEAKSPTCKIVEDSKFGADTHLDPLSRLLQSVWKSVKTARLCYLERPTPEKGEVTKKSHLQNSSRLQIWRRHSSRPAGSFGAIGLEIRQNGEAVRSIRPISIWPKFGADVDMDAVDHLQQSVFQSVKTARLC